ncbi:unnamed protein product [Clonostachys chloroleuca]|uniref:Uncharacterized protein n=1 Tax=Clonostachys chloroleuca TaxID=1926264 RepID=A0AA35QAK6_9HYPO|nr:unnamed protein product [Clonostachys chloroleuca]
MTHRRQETELPLLDNGGRQNRQNRQKPRRLASSRRFPAQATQNFVDSDMDHSRTTTRSVDRDQEGSVLDGYATETSSSTQTMVIPNTRPHDASDNTRSKLLRAKGALIHIEDDGSEKWHPFWLHPAVLGVFFAFFLGCAVALPVLLSISNRNDGLLEAQVDLEQLWRFGPTAVFTMVTIFWGRVELQTLRYFPWVKVQNSNDTSIYELDYTSKISLTVLLQSLRNKHFLVFIITLTTLLLKVQVVLIPSLFSLKTVQLSRPVVIQTSDFFDTDFTYRIPSSENSIGYYNFKAIQDFGTGVPFGVGNNSIYQTFTQANSEKDARGTVDSPLTARVDGLFFDLECRELESCTTILKENQPKPFSKDQYVAWLQVDLKFEGCPQTVLLNITEDFYGITNRTNQWDSEVWKTANSPTNCSALPNQFPQYINLAARWSSSSTNASIPVQDACAAVICSPTAWVSKVEVLDDGDHPIMTVLPDQIKTPMHVNPYTLFESSVPNALGAIACGFLASFSSLLFTSANIPGNSDISLKQQSWFGNRTLAQASEPGKLSDYEIARYALGGLIISPKSSQFTWPSFTYQNLLFPRLEMDGPSKDWNSSVSFELEVPAIQLISDCAQLPQSALHLRKQRYYSQWEMTINMTRTCPNGTIVDVVGYHYPNYNTYTFSEIYARTEPCPSQYWMEKTWIWGQVFENGTYSHPSIWSCNYTWAEIPTKLQLVWTTDGFQVDHANPPQPDYSRTKLLEPSFPIDTQTFDRFDNLWPKPDLGFAVGVAETPESIDARFKYLFEPVGSLKLENIINPDDAQKTIEALNSGISLVSGQIANALRRLDIDEASTTSPEHPGELPPFTAKVTDKRRRRLVQNAVITYLVIGVISLAFVVNAWALLSSGLKRFIGYRGKWLLDLEMKDLVPSDYNSIAVSASLLSPSNYPKYVRSLDEFYTRLSGLRFRMGWFIRKGAQERELTIGVLDDPEFLFLGGKQSSK